MTVEVENKGPIIAARETGSGGFWCQLLLLTSFLSKAMQQNIV